MILALLLGLAPGAAAGERETGARWLVGQLPEGTGLVAPEARQRKESAVVEVAYHGAGLCMRFPEWSGDGRSFVVAEPSDACDIAAIDHVFGTPESLKVVAYFPGYRVATFESEWRQLGSPTTWEIEPKRLDPAPVTGRVMDHDGVAVAGAEVEITYSLFELMAYFGYDDGAVPSLDLARVRTDAGGEFRAEIPKLIEDPFFDAGLEMVQVWVGGRPVTRLSLNELFGGRVEVVVAGNKRQR